MPILRRNARGNFYIFTKSASGQVVTLQVSPAAEPTLRQLGIQEGDDLGIALRTLKENDWLYTRGEVNGGGELGPSGLIKRPAPLTIPWNGQTKYAPRFLYNASNSTHYTELYVENSSDCWIVLHMIIKHHGALELIKLGAVIGQEFTQRALHMMLERRWVYSDSFNLEATSQVE